MKKLLISAFLLCLTLQVAAQYPENQYDIFRRSVDLNEKALAFGLTEAQFEAIKDQAYANPSFIPGIIYQDNKPLKTGVPMRYNAFADEIEMKPQNASDASALVKDPNIYVKMGTQFYVFVPFEGSNEKGGYFNVLYEGKRFSLYKKVTASFKEAEIAQTTYGRDTPPSFPKTTTYFLVDNGTFLELSKNKKKIRSTFKEADKNMSEYLKNNNPDFSKESDLSRVVEHLDSLKKS